MPDRLFDRIELCPNTRRARRLIHRMQQQGDANAVVERLFSAHLQRGEKVGSLDELVRIAAERGWDEAEAHAYLNSSEGNDEVSRKALWDQQIGISVVLFFIFNGRPGIGGAHRRRFCWKSFGEGWEFQREFLKVRSLQSISACTTRQCSQLVKTYEVDQR